MIGLAEEAVSEPSVEFTSITALDVDSRGRIYVGDFFQPVVTVLGPDGRRLRTFGRRGSGPGEFRAIRGIQLLPGDSVLVYDPGLARVSVYAPEGAQPAYVTNLAAKRSGPAPFHLWRARANDGYLALFRPAFMFRDGVAQPAREDVVRVLELDGAPRGDRLLAFPSRSFLVASSSVMPNPFGREGLVRPDSKDRLHFVWSDSLRVRTFALDGEAAGGFAHPHDPPPVTARDVRREIEGLDGEGRATFGATLRDSVPERWPAVRDLLVDESDRVWIALGGAPGDPTEWVAFTTAGAYLGSVRVPQGVAVRLVRGGRMYAEWTDDRGVPRVVVLRLDRPV
ncbi:MAG TPA: hypothetical protein VHG51_15000 [Longimicrobiaceae bacterium]|nr:hypothetical protein [Longimicrobiaceae bacterium]